MYNTTVVHITHSAVRCSGSNRSHVYAQANTLHAGLCELLALTVSLSYFAG